jgi:hypothetical protein
MVDMAKFASADTLEFDVVSVRRLYKLEPC